MIEVDSVKKVFHQGQPNEFWAIRGISLTISAKQVTLFKGPSGSGKSTLLSLLGALSRPTSGRISLNGKSLSGLPERFSTLLRRQSIGFVFQDFQLIQGLTVKENVMLPAYPLGESPGILQHRADSLLERFSLQHKATARVEWLSGGEAQRTAICRALINQPQILIADEPTANLDSQLSRDFLAMIDGLQQEGKTILLSSHDPLVYQSSMINRIVELHDGKVVTNTC